MPSISKPEARITAKRIWNHFLQDSARVKNASDQLRDFLKESSGATLCYAAMKDELDVLTVSFDSGRMVFLPRVSGERLSFHRVVDASNLIRSGMGILEPDPKSEEFKLPAGAEDCLIVPCLAVNIEGCRLGRGGGYYDRMKSAFQTCVTVTILPEEAVLDFQGEPHDLLIKKIIRA